MFGMKWITPRFGGEPVKEYSESTVPLYHIIQKPENGYWLPWSKYTDCFCNGSEHFEMKFRNRTCISPKHGGLNCTGQSQEAASCNCLPVWGAWSVLYQCPLDCGPQQARRRECRKGHTGGECLAGKSEEHCWNTCESSEVLSTSYIVVIVVAGVLLSALIPLLGVFCYRQRQLTNSKDIISLPSNPNSGIYRSTIPSSDREAMQLLTTEQIFKPDFTGPQIEPECSFFTDPLLTCYLKLPRLSIVEGTVHQQNICIFKRELTHILKCTVLCDYGRENNLTHTEEPDPEKNLMTGGECFEYNFSNSNFIVVVLSPVLLYEWKKLRNIIDDEARDALSKEYVLPALRKISELDFDCLQHCISSVDEKPVLLVQLAWYGHSFERDVRGFLKHDCRIYRLCHQTGLRDFTRRIFELYSKLKQGTAM